MVTKLMGSMADCPHWTPGHPLGWSDLQDQALSPCMVWAKLEFNMANVKKDKYLEAFTKVTPIYHRSRRKTGFSILQETRGDSRGRESRGQEGRWI